MTEVVKKLMKRGFSKGKSKILNDNELKELREFLLKYREDFNQKYRENRNSNIQIEKKTDSNEIGKVNKSNVKPVMMDIAGVDSRVDQILEKILSNDGVQNTLKEILGENYLLWRPQARFTEPDDKGLEIHQDAVGETGLLFLVDDQSDGTTIILPGSHLIPSKKQLANRVSWNSIRLLKFIKYFFSPVRGEAGEHFFWFYRAWHGRVPGTQKTKITLFFPFFPIHAKRIDMAEENEKLLDWKNINQSNLKKSMSKDRYISSVSKLNDTNIKNNSNTYLPLCMQINSLRQIISGINHFSFAILKVTFLELVFFPIHLLRFLRRVRR